MDWLIDLFNKLLSFLYSLIISLVDMLKDLFIWIFEQIFEVVNLLLKSVLSIFEPVDISNFVGAIPSNTAWVMSQIGLPQCLSIIAIAITARLLLQLIPFVRLGS